MHTESFYENGKLYLEDDLWKFRSRDEGTNSQVLQANSDLGMNYDRNPIFVGIAAGPKGMDLSEAQKMVDRILQSQLPPKDTGLRSSMTLVEFVERKFIPEYVARIGLSGRMYYRSMLKHLVRPEVIDRLFHVDSGKVRARSRSVAGWPYFDDMPLSDIGPAAVQNLTSVALARGYSAQTVVHLRSVIRTIFAYAQKEICFRGENPAVRVHVPKTRRAEWPILSRSEIVRLISLMSYPEKELVLIAVVTGMSIGEICALRWMRVNLSDTKTQNIENETVPPMTLVVKEEWVRSQLIGMVKRSESNIEIPWSIVPVLQNLKTRGGYRDDRDFVLTSRAGRPVNPTNGLTRKLKIIGKEMDMPWLSWQHLRRSHAALVRGLGGSFQNEMASLVQEVYIPAAKKPPNRLSITEPELPY